MEQIFEDLRQRYEISELDELKAIWPGGAVTPVQLSSGSLDLVLDGVVQADFSLLHMSLSPRVADRIVVQNDRSGFVLAERPLVWGGVEIVPPALLVASPGREYRSLLQPGFQSLEFLYSNASLCGHPVEHLLRRLAKLDVDHVPLGAAQVARLRETADAYIDLSAGTLLVGDALSPAQLRRPVLDVIAGILAGHLSRVMVREHLCVKRRSLVLAALDEIDRIGVRDVRVRDLYESLGISRRALEKAFGSALGVSPGQYLLASRLNQLRRDLLGSSTRVVDSIFNAGFSDASRAARHYRRLFGELPSVTLKRAQIG